jgi:PAS domain S-box-containing protein
MAESLRILILEDNPADAELVQFELQEAGLAFTSKVVMTEDDFVREIQGYCPDLILSDYDLPKYNGALALAEARKRCPDTPFILVTGAVTEDRAIDILTQGAKDYVLKARLQQRLAPAVRRALEEAGEHQARKKAEAELREAHRTLERQVVERSEALRKTEGLYHSLFDNMLEGFAYCRMIFDQDHAKDFIYLDVNRSFESLTGLKNVVGKKVSEVIPGIRESDAELIETYSRVALTGKPERFEQYVRSLRMWFSVSVYSPAREYFVAVFDVITERKRIEEELRKSEGQFHTLADSIPNLAWWANPDGYITWYNKRWYEYTGATPEQMEGWGWQSVHDPKVLPKVLEQWRASISTGEPFDMDFPLRGADGVFRLFLTRVIPLKDSDGQVLRWFGTNTDISALKEAEENLQDSERRYRRLFEAAKDGVLILDADTGKVVDVNPFLLQLLGYSYEEICGKHLWEIGSFKDIAASKDAFKTLQDNEYVRYDDLPLETRDGQAIAVEFVSNVYLVDHKKVIQCNIRDITERKQAGMELDERTRQLEELNRELESFSYSVSHDLRAPLRAIDGYSRMILKKGKDKFDEDTWDKFQVIRSNAQKMNQLIEDLLSFAHLARLEPSVSNLDMQSLFHDAWKEQQQINPDRVMTLKIDKLPECMGDQNLMTQVCINLLSNAVKFTKQRNVTLVEIGGYLENNECVYFVRDNGAGFDMASHDKLFGVFQRLHSSIEYEGTGIGLALVKRIINRHGGRIWAEGKVDKGATFYFALPQKRD